METLLQELSSASKLLTDLKEMYEYETRLKTFTKWPFQGNCKCTPENVSLKWLFGLCLNLYILCLNAKSLLSIFRFKRRPLNLKMKS